MTTCLRQKWFIFDARDAIVGQVEASQCFIELKTVIQSADLGAGDGELSDVGVESDGNDIMGPWGAGDSKTRTKLALMLLTMHISAIAFWICS